MQSGKTLAKRGVDALDIRGIDDLFFGKQGSNPLLHAKQMADPFAPHSAPLPPFDRLHQSELRTQRAARLSPLVRRLGDIKGLAERFLIGFPALGDDEQGSHFGTGLHPLVEFFEKARTARRRVPRRAKAGWEPLSPAIVETVVDAQIACAFPAS